MTLLVDPDKSVSVRSVAVRRVEVRPGDHVTFRGREREISGLFLGDDVGHWDLLEDPRALDGLVLPSSHLIQIPKQRQWEIVVDQMREAALDGIGLRFGSPLLELEETNAPTAGIPEALGTNGAEVLYRDRGGNLFFRPIPVRAIRLGCHSPQGAAHAAIGACAPSQR